MQRLHTKSNFISKFEKPAKAKFDDFYVLGYNFVKTWLNRDFLVSADSRDPEDFKTGLKKAKEDHCKAVQLSKVCLRNSRSPVNSHLNACINYLNSKIIKDL